MSKVFDWPPEGARGPALDKAESAQTLGISVEGVNQALKRSRAGVAKESFPEPDGYAKRADAGGPTRMKAYWWRSTIVGYGKRAGHLNRKGKLVTATA